MGGKKQAQRTKGNTKVVSDCRKSCRRKGDTCKLLSALSIKQKLNLTITLKPDPYTNPNPNPVYPTDLAKPY